MEVQSGDNMETRHQDGEWISNWMEDPRMPCRACVQETEALATTCCTERGSNQHHCTEEQAPRDMTARRWHHRTQRQIMPNVARQKRRVHSRPNVAPRTTFKTKFTFGYLQKLDVLNVHRGKKEQKMCQNSEKKCCELEDKIRSGCCKVGHESRSRSKFVKNHGDAMTLVLYTAHWDTLTWETRNFFECPFKI